MKRFILILFLLLAAREIRAFGLAGHAAIACIAEHHLTPRARANIMRYTDHRSIVYYASWMDEWRRSREGRLRRGRRTIDCAALRI